MFRKLEAENHQLTIFVDGNPHKASQGDSVAATLLHAGITSFNKNPVSGDHRLPHCMTGNCYECLVTIDDKPYVQACLVEVQDGMRIKLTQHPDTIPNHNR